MTLWPENQFGCCYIKLYLHNNLKQFLFYVLKQGINSTFVSLADTGRIKKWEIFVLAITQEGINENAIRLVLLERHPFFYKNL